MYLHSLHNILYYPDKVVWNSNFVMLLEKWITVWKENILTNHIYFVFDQNYAEQVDSNLE